MTIKSITPTAINMLNAEIQEALQSIAKKHNVSIRTGKSKYSETNYTVSVEVAIKSEDGEAQTAIVADFKRYREMYGIIPNLGDSFRFEGSLYTVIGLRTSSRKFPVVCQRPDGKKVCIGVQNVNQSFKAIA